MPYGVIMHPSSPGARDYQNCRVRHRKLPYRLLVEGVRRFPKQ